MNNARCQLIAMLVLAVTIAGAAHGAEQPSADSGKSLVESAKALGEAVKREFKAVGKAAADGAHQVGAAAKRGAKQVQDAVQDK